MIFAFLMRMDEILPMFYWFLPAENALDDAGLDTTINYFYRPLNLNPSGALRRVRQNKRGVNHHSAIPPPVSHPIPNAVEIRLNGTF